MTQAPSRRPRNAPPASGLDRYFRITERGSSVGQEVRGGIVTFFTMAYIVVLNPLIIGTVPDSTGGFLGGGDPDRARMLVAAGTALVAGLMTILMGVVANFPLALATGLGLNAFLAYGVAKMPQMTWADAMGLIVLEGIIILVLVLTGFRKAVFHAIPAQLKTAISVGIGLFITLIGLIDAGFVRKPAGPTPVELGIGGFLNGWPLLTFVVGLFLIIALMVNHVKGAILYGIAGATVLAIVLEAVLHIGSQTGPGGKIVNPTGWGLNVPTLPSNPFALPDFSLVGDFNLLGSFSKIGFVSAALLIFTLLLADFFDTMGTMVAIGGEAGLLDEEGNPPGSQRILVVDSVAAIAGGMGSVSSNTSYIESAAGVGEGARTGLASVVTGVMFLLATFLSPLVAVVPYEAATPALIVVGFLMMQQVTGIDWDDMEIAIPAFLTIVLMPFSYSISVGIGAGFVAYVVVKIARRKAREIHPLLWIVAGLFVLYFCITPVKTALGVA